MTIAPASPTSPWPGTTTAGLEAFELLQHGDPAVAVDVDLVGREPRKDREAAALDEIAREQDPLFREEDDLVASRVPETERAELGSAAPEYDLRRSLVRDVRLDQLHVLELLGDRVAEGPEPLEIRRALRAQLVELLPVVDDRRAVREGLRAEAVLRVEVRDR